MVPGPPLLAQLFGLIFRRTALSSPFVSIAFAPSTRAAIEYVFVTSFDLFFPSWVVAALPLPVGFSPERAAPATRASTAIAVHHWDWVIRSSPPRVPVHSEHAGRDYIRREEKNHRQLAVGPTEFRISPEPLVLPRVAAHVVAV